MTERSEALSLDHIVLEKELLNRQQLRHCRQTLENRRQEGQTPELGTLMVELGYLTEPQLTAVRAESQRRRRQIKGYELKREVGRGAVGTVYLARQIKMDREVAVKILSPELARRPDVVERYLAEARAVAKLNHPHIVQGIDTGESAGSYFFAMEFLSGGSLKERLEADGPLPEARALIYLYQMASALHHAGERQIIHCDIKPANLMIEESGQLKLTDLGLAQIGETFAERDAEGRRVVRGTPHYISPEQVETPGQIDCRADIYALGATFFHLTTGATPFGGENAREVMAARLRSDPRPAREIRPELSAGFSDLLGRMLARRREDRPASPAALIEELLKLGVEPDAAGDLLSSIRINKEGRKSSLRAQAQIHARNTPASGIAATTAGRRTRPRTASRVSPLALTLGGLALIAVLLGVAAYFYFR